MWQSKSAKTSNQKLESTRKIWMKFEKSIQKYARFSKCVLHILDALTIFSLSPQAPEMMRIVKKIWVCTFSSVIFISVNVNTSSLFSNALITEKICVWHFKCVYICLIHNILCLPTVKWTAYARHLSFCNWRALCMSYIYIFRGRCNCIL